MITLHSVERDGERILLRFAAGDDAVLDVLTDAASIAEAQYMPDVTDRRFAKMQQ